MGDVKQLSKSFKPKFERERQLETQPIGQTDAVPEEDTFPRTKEIRENFRRVSDKAQRIHDEAVKLAITRSVPVDQDSTEVRGGVVRQDPDSKRFAISFDLYRRSYEYVQKADRSLPPEILDNMTGDFSTDSLRMQRTIRELTDEITADQAELLGDQVLTLFILQLLLMGYNSLSTGSQTATKQPTALELPVIAIQIATSLVAQQTYAGLNEDAAKAALEELQGQVPDLDMDAAARLLQNSDLFNNALLQKRPGDYQMIVTYVDAFLARQNRPGWETWRLLPDLKEEITWTEESAQMLDRYERPASTTSVEPPDDAISQIGHALGNFVSVGTSNNAPVMPSDSTLDLMQRALRSANRQVDEIAHVLSDVGIDTDDLCCFIKWMNEIGTEPISMIREYLNVSQNALNEFDGLPDINIRRDLSISTRIHQTVMFVLQDLQESLNKEVARWFRTDNEKWLELFQQCKLIDELIEYVTGTLEVLQQKLVSLLNRYLGYLEAKEVKLQSKMNTTGGQLKIRSYMTVIDQWLDFGGSEGGICPDTPAEPMQIASAAERVLSGLGARIQLPPSEEENEFSIVASPPLVLDNGIQLPSAPGGSAGTSLQDAAIESCRLGTVKQNLVPFPRGQ